MKSRYFVVLILGLVLSSCSASWHIKKAKQRCGDCFTEKSDTIINVIKRDTIINIDTTFMIDFSDYIEIDEPIKIRDTIIKLMPFKSDVITTIDEGVIVKSWVENNRIRHIIEIDTLLPYHFKQQLRLKDALIQRHVEVIREKNVIIKEKAKLIDYLKLGIAVIIILLVAGFAIKLIYMIRNRPVG